jgi:hypothetical protein
VPAAPEKQPEPGKVSSESTHPATREDCELVIDQNVAAQLRASNITDPAIIEKRKQEIRTAMADDIQSCIGRKVTAETLSCVRQAETAQAIDACLQR